MGTRARANNEYKSLDTYSAYSFAHRTLPRPGRLAREPGSPRSTMSAAIAALALTVTLLLLEAPGTALAQGAAGRGRLAGKKVLKRSKPSPADLDRSILLEWRKGSAQLQRVWSDESAPMSAWEGVTVGEEGRVVEFYLDGKGLTSVPAALGRLSALELLRLGGNQLTSVPAELGGLTALKELDLDMNQLTSVPAAIGKLTALTRLGLGGNQLTSVPAELGGLTALKRLFLGENPLTSVPAEWERGGELEQSGCAIRR